MSELITKVKNGIENEEKCEQVLEGRVQNEFFNRLRKNRTTVKIYFVTGDSVIGHIITFDKYSILLRSKQSEELIFKHGIATVNVNKDEIETTPLENRSAN